MKRVTLKRAAEILGITPRHLRRLIGSHRISVEREPTIAARDLARLKRERAR